MYTEVRAVTKYVRMSAHKVRLIADLVRGKSVDEALAILRFSPRAAAKEVAKTISSAAANADNNNGLAREELYISEIRADEGPMLKRGRAGARGRHMPILKRSAHITVVLSEKVAD